VHQRVGTGTCALSASVNLPQGTHPAPAIAPGGFPDDLAGEPEGLQAITVCGFSTVCSEGLELVTFWCSMCPVQSGMARNIYKIDAVPAGRFASLCDQSSFVAAAA
jgi:hypothetical protein